MSVPALALSSDKWNFKSFLKSSTQPASWRFQAVLMHAEYQGDTASLTLTRKWGWRCQPSSGEPGIAMAKPHVLTPISPRRLGKERETAPCKQICSCLVLCSPLKAFDKAKQDFSVGLVLPHPHKRRQKVWATRSEINLQSTSSLYFMQTLPPALGKVHDLPWTCSCRSFSCKTFNMCRIQPDCNQQPLCMVAGLLLQGAEAVACEEERLQYHVLPKQCLGALLCVPVAGPELHAWPHLAQMKPRHPYAVH